MQRLINYAKNGMLGCVYDILKIMYKVLPTSLTWEQIDEIRRKLPPHISNAQLQHIKTADESEAQIRNVLREIQTAYSDIMSGSFPDCRHITVNQAVLMLGERIIDTRCRSEISTGSSSANYNISVTAFVSLLRRLSGTEYNLSVKMPQIFVCFALTDYSTDVKKLLHNYPAFWYYIMGQKKCSDFGISRGEYRKVSHICSRPDMPLDDNCTDWMIGIDLHHSTQGKIFEGFLSSHVPRTWYRHLTSLSNASSAIGDLSAQASGMSLTVESNGELNKIFEFRLQNSSGEFNFTVNTRRPNYTSSTYVSIDTIYQQIVPNDRADPIVPKISSTHIHPEANECVICLDAPRSHLCAPCGHKILCSNCRIDICPICRMNIERIIKVYDS